ncbi:MAG: site-specific DNA-methyltransferase [Thermoplasmata archaeon]|nr:MAG: site-specific DNA-methyltransferase [Thermoplasmata archaeon]
MKTHHKIILGDSRKMQEVEDESVHLIITSPPYWQLKDYGEERQIGFHHSYEDYINNLNLVWNECSRVLHKGCRLCINIGDQFARSVYYGRYKVIPIRTEMIKFCESANFDYLGAIIWQKITTTHTTGGANIMGSYPYPRNGILKLDYEFILIFKKYGEGPKVGRDAKNASKLSADEWNEYFAGHWNFPGEKQTKHLAMFPEELPRRLIKMFSFEGEVVLDPFLGSGTTSLAARNLGRNSIGYEINTDFLPTIKEKLDLNQTKLIQDSEFELITQDKLDLNFNDEINKLPYIFKDPIRFDKKVDPREFKFGSKVDKSTSEREEYYTVKKIVNPEILILNDNLNIRLIGVRARADKEKEAINFLKSKTKGQKVFLKFDEIEYDDNDYLQCYLYLKNRTFINAHLIKNDLVDVDTESEYKHRSRFINYTPSK